METRDSASIHGYHAHINFDPETRNIAVAMREELGNRFDVVLGRVWDEPVGPHVKSMFQIAFEPAEFAKVVPWLMVNHHGLSIFIHPETGNALEDHRDNALWLNENLGLKLDALD